MKALVVAAMMAIGTTGTVSGPAWSCGSGAIRQLTPYEPGGPSALRDGSGKTISVEQHMAGCAALDKCLQSEPFSEDDFQKYVIQLARAASIKTFKVEVYGAKSGLVANVAVLQSDRIDAAGGRRMIAQLSNGSSTCGTWEVDNK